MTSPHNEASWLRKSNCVAKSTSTSLMCFFIICLFVIYIKILIFKETYDIIVVVNWGFCKVWFYLANTYITSINKRDVKTMEKKLFRSKINKKLCGVCGGIAEYFNIDPTIVRLIWVLAVLFAGCGILAYIIAAFVMPEKPE